MAERDPAERVTRPSALGKFEPTRPLLWIANGALVISLAFVDYRNATSTFFSVLAIATIALVATATVVRIARGPVDPANGVDLSGHELTVTVGEETTIIPLAEATVRVVDEYPERSRVRKLYIDHENGSTEVDTEGMAPLRITEYGEKLTDSFVERRRIMLIKEPQQLPPS